jgi:hypothetical protein
MNIAGSSWRPLSAPSDSPSCPSDTCSLHLHSVTDAHNYGRIFSSPAPGFVMGVGSVGSTLAPYEDSNTYMSTDAGLTWTMVREGAHLYEFGDSGSVIVIVDNEQVTDSILYSTDMGQTWYVPMTRVHFCDSTETPAPQDHIQRWRPDPRQGSDDGVRLDVSEVRPPRPGDTGVPAKWPPQRCHLPRFRHPGASPVW